MTTNVSYSHHNTTRTTYSFYPILKEIAYKESIKKLLNSNDNDTVIFSIEDNAKEKKQENIQESSLNDQDHEEITDETSSEISKEDFQMMLSEFAQPKGAIFIYKDWFKKLVTQIKKSSVVDIQIEEIGDCLVANYNSLETTTKGKRNSVVYYKNITKFFYWLYFKSLGETSFYLEIFNKLAYKWSKLNMSDEEKAKYYLLKIRMYLAKGHHRFAKKNLKLGLKISPQNTKLLQLQETIKEIFPQKTVPSKRKICEDNRQFYYGLYSKKYRLEEKRSMVTLS